MISIEVLSFLAIVFCLLFFLRMARVGALVAFLFAGILSGPYMLNLFELTGTWQILGDIGILFLWFSIGLEISFSRLWNLRNTIFGFGAAQVLMVAVMLFPMLVGITSWSLIGTVMISLILAMSSSALIWLRLSKNMLLLSESRSSRR